MLCNLSTNSHKTGGKIKCPSCGKPMVWNTENPWRPFCSERCKLIDLGDWIEERHRIPDSDPHSELESSE
jgi:endogenous inhibitor of DNA gyrase (YacG/DUF329 family)